LVCNISDILATKTKTRLDTGP